MKFTIEEYLIVIICLFGYAQMKSYRIKQFQKINVTVYYQPSVVSTSHVAFKDLTEAFPGPKSSNFFNLKIFALINKNKIANGRNQKLTPYECQTKRCVTNIVHMCSLLYLHSSTKMKQVIGFIRYLLKYSFSLQSFWNLIIRRDAKHFNVTNVNDIIRCVNSKADLDLITKKRSPSNIYTSIILTKRKMSVEMPEARISNEISNVTVCIKWQKLTDGNFGIANCHDGILYRKSLSAILATFMENVLTRVFNKLNVKNKEKGKLGQTF